MSLFDFSTGCLQNLLFHSFILFFTPPYLGRLYPAICKSCCLFFCIVFYQPNDITNQIEQK